MTANSTTKDHQINQFEEKEIGQIVANENLESSFLESEVVLKVENISKKFCRNLRRSMWYGITDFVKGFFGIKPDTETLRPDEFWALKDVSFELRENEILGIIGANGSGKSTLLRILTGIFPPDKGRVLIEGKVGGIIALGAGMHPHMTGRENIYLNGTILGMGKDEIDVKFEEIVAFAELDDFIDAPLSTYSSGMKVRLGFAVAVHCEPEILLVDEVLAVGDRNFQNKSLLKMREYIRNGKAMIFISHNIENIEKLCTKILVLNKGEKLYYGEVDPGVKRYEFNLDEKSLNDSIITSTSDIHDSFELQNIACFDSIRDQRKIFEIGEDIFIRFTLSFLEKFDNEILEFFIVVNSIESDKQIIRISEKLNICKNLVQLELALRSINLNRGSYFFHLSIKSLDGVMIGRVKTKPLFIVKNKVMGRQTGIIHIDFDLKLMEK